MCPRRGSGHWRKSMARALSFSIICFCVYTFLRKFKFFLNWNKKLHWFVFWWYWETKHPKIGKGRHEIFMKRNLATNIFIGVNSLTFFEFFDNYQSHWDVWQFSRASFCWNSKFRIFLPAASDKLLWTPQWKLLIFQSETYPAGLFWF